jgi:hypothetical protein
LLLAILTTGDMLLGILDLLVRHFGFLPFFPFTQRPEDIHNGGYCREHSRYSSDVFHSERPSLMTGVPVPLTNVDVARKALYRHKESSFRGRLGGLI